MRYDQIIPGKFILRRNRFIAEVEVAGKVETVHVKNTGRCKELLLPGTDVFLERSANPARKTGYDLIAVKKIRPEKEPLLINMDSQAPNIVAAEWLPISGIFSPGTIFQSEVTCKNSRFDFSAVDGECKSFIEVKGVTLEFDGIAMFPDAPTARGVKHLEELIQCRKEGLGAYLLFVIQMKGISCFRPCDQIHREFGDALRRAADAGVNILAMDCTVTPDSLEIDRPVKLCLR